MGRFIYLAQLVLLSGGLLFAADSQVCPDLDGDHKPDVLRVSAARRDSLGYFYTLDFEMSSGAARNSIQVRSKSPHGVRVVPRDVDGDHDVDLVITNFLDLQPISILLNDGDGAFTATEVTSWNWLQPRKESLTAPAPANGLAGTLAFCSPQVIAPVSRGTCSWNCPPSASVSVARISPGDSGVARSCSSRAPPLR